MERDDIRQALSTIELMNVLDLYFEARTGLHCFSDEFMPANLLCELNKIESRLHQCYGSSLLRTAIQESTVNAMQSGDKADSD